MIHQSLVMLMSRTSVSFRYIGANKQIDIIEWRDQSHVDALGLHGDEVGFERVVDLNGPLVRELHVVVVFDGAIF